MYNTSLFADEKFQGYTEKFGNQGCTVILLAASLTYDVIIKYINDKNKYILSK
jgi:hypothetical protein